jgi:hypothetical protein
VPDTATRVRKTQNQHIAGYFCSKQNLSHMEVVTIEKKTFEAMLTEMRSLTEKVYTLQHKCNEKRLAQWLDGQEVCLQLRISPRTLQTMRDNRLIGYTQINRKFYYSPEEVVRLLPLVKTMFPK